MYKSNKFKPYTIKDLREATKGMSDDAIIVIFEDEFCHGIIHNHNQCLGEKNDPIAENGILQLGIGLFQEEDFQCGDENNKDYFTQSITSLTQRYTGQKNFYNNK